MSYELRLGSCLDPVTGLASLADDSVDVTITDPPYEAEAHDKGKRQGPIADRIKRVVDEQFDFAPMTEVDRAAVGFQIGRVTRKLALVFCQIESAMLWRAALEAGGLAYRRTIPWVKPDAMPSLHGRWPGQACEVAVLAMRTGVTAPIGGKARYYETTKERGLTRSHPTAKPLELMRQIVVDFTLPGERVLDCYVGSGSTGVACNQLGRRFIGWELSPEYHAIATRRLNGDEAKPRPEQPGLFSWGQ